MGKDKAYLVRISMDGKNLAYKSIRMTIHDIKELLYFLEMELKSTV